MGKSYRKFKMINWLKGKYYWFKLHYKLKTFINKFSDTKVLLFGYPKSGNTWLRLLLFNYRNLLLNPIASNTITFDILNDLQNNIMDRGTIFSPKNGMPFFYRTHMRYIRTYNLFDKKVFIHRNPLDTLISSYYFYKNREVPFLFQPEDIREKLHDIDFYVSYNISSWIKFYYISIEHADFVMNYSEMKRDPLTSFSNLLRFLEWDFDSSLVEKAVKFSSFKRIKEMGEKNSQKYGNGPKDGSFNGEFTRSGEESQFHHELKKETIQLVLDKFPEFKNVYPNLIE